MGFLFFKYRRKKQLPPASLLKGGSETFLFGDKMERILASYSSLLDYKFIFLRTRCVSESYDLEMSPRSLASLFLEM